MKNNYLINAVKELGVKGLLEFIQDVFLYRKASQICSSGNPEVLLFRSAWLQGLMSL